MDRVMDFEKVGLGSFKKISIYHEQGGMGMGMMGGHSAVNGNAETGGHGMGMGMMGMRHRQENSTGDNKSGMGEMGGGMGMMLDMAHPIHLHGQQFQIIKRDTSGVNATDYETVKHGFIDTGWKDTVLVMPGEKVDIIKPFQDYKGLFLYHCHNLEHEDLGMMRQFLVE